MGIIPSIPTFTSRDKNEINMELEDNVYNQIVLLAEEGDDFAENEIFGSAISKYNKALDLLPEPKTDWEAATWLYIALGDALFSEKDFETALSAYEKALMSPDGTVNPYIWFCLGEVFYELGNFEIAKTHFMSAYLLDGEEIFKNTKPVYMSLIKEEIGKSSDQPN